MEGGDAAGYSSCQAAEHLPGQQGRPQGMEMGHVEGPFLMQARQGVEFARTRPGGLESGAVHAPLAETADPQHAVAVALFPGGRRVGTGCQDHCVMPGPPQGAGEVEDVPLHAARAGDVVGADLQDSHRNGCC